MTTFYAIWYLIYFYPPPTPPFLALPPLPPFLALPQPTTGMLLMIQLLANLSANSGAINTGICMTKFLLLSD